MWISWVQEPSIVALCDAVKNGLHGEIVPEASPKDTLCTRTLKDFLEQQSGITLQSRSPLLAWLVEHCSNLLVLFHKGEPHDCHTAYMRLKGKPWMVEMPSLGECVDYRNCTGHQLKSRSRRVFAGVRVKTAERIVGHTP